MKYDLIVVGGGPGGLMAARTAAEDGLKVLLIEQKKDLTRITRACSQIFYINKLSPSGESESGEAHIDGYTEPVSVEILPNKSRFNFPVPGFSLDYEGTLRPYYNWIQLSPSGYQMHIYQLNDKIWGLYYDKGTFLAGLLTSAERAGTEVWTGTTGMSVENTLDGVKVRIKRKAEELVLEATTVIAADGVNSRIIDSLGLNTKRRIFGPVIKSLIYVVEGVESNLPQASWLSWSIPSINSFSNIFMGLIGKDAHQLGTMGMGKASPSGFLENFMTHPGYAHIFRHARVVRKMADVSIIRTPITEPVVGNVVFAGDAGGPGDTWIQGAVACGYQAAKAIKKKLNGQNGYQEYTDWWHRALAWNNPDFFNLLTRVYPLNRICSDEEVDYIYSLFQDKVGIVSLVISKNLELIRTERPELFNKLMQSKQGV